MASPFDIEEIFPDDGDHAGPAAPAAGRQLAAGRRGDPAGRLHAAYPRLVAVRRHRRAARRVRREPRPARGPRSAGWPAVASWRAAGRGGAARTGSAAAAAASLSVGGSWIMAAADRGATVGRVLDARRLLAAPGAQRAAAGPARPAPLAGIRAAVRRTVDLPARADPRRRRPSSPSSPSAR